MADRDQQIAQLRETVRKDPGSAEFVELAGLLSEDPNTRSEAREVCFRGICENPNALRGRLMLSRLFYLDGLLEFSARELAELRKFSNVPSLMKLMDAFGSYIRPYSPVDLDQARSGKSKSDSDDKESGDEVLAEIDLDADFVDVLNELEDK